MVIICCANHVSSQLRNLDPWRALIEGMDLKLRLNGPETSLRPSKYVWAYDWHFLDSQLVQILLMEGLTHLQLFTIPYHIPLPFPLTYPFIHSTHDITVVVEKVARNPAVLRSQLVEIVIKHYLKDFQLYNIPSMATIQHKKTTVVLIFEIGIFQNIKCDELVGFPKSG